jgi:hypothetical protein
VRTNGLAALDQWVEEPTGRAVVVDPDASKLMDCFEEYLNDIVIYN